MHKHSLFYDDKQKAPVALDWILDNFRDIEDWDFSFDGLALFFYTAYALTERQKEIIVTTVNPVSFISELL